MSIRTQLWGLIEYMPICGDLLFVYGMYEKPAKYHRRSRVILLVSPPANSPPSSEIIVANSWVTNTIRHFYQKIVKFTFGQVMSGDCNAGRRRYSLTLIYNLSHLVVCDLYNSENYSPRGLGSNRLLR